MFNKKGQTFWPNKYNTINKLEPGVYAMVWNKTDYRTELNFLRTKFDLPERVYNLDTEFIDRIIRSFYEKNGNLGVLVNGYKGTGKTILCKAIANKTNLPVFVLPETLDKSDIFDIFNNLTQDCVFFLDEYEKQWKTNDALLTLMDGALALKFKILFLLTTNDINISEYMINRPNRIHYVRSYEPLNQDEVFEVINDKLKNKDHIPNFLECLKKIETPTIDIICSIIEEVNRFNISPSKAIMDMNVTLRQNTSKFGLKK